MIYFIIIRLRIGPTSRFKASLTNRTRRIFYGTEFVVKYGHTFCMKFEYVVPDIEL
jgi:hypothetical protein